MRQRIAHWRLHPVGAGITTAEGVASAGAGPVVRAAAAPWTDRSTLNLFAFLMVHPVVLYVVGGVPQNLSTLHAYATFMIGAWFASTGRFDRVAPVLAYIAGSEVLWRMTRAGIYWEFGKYATSAIVLIALARRGRLKPPAIPFFFFALLIPSTFLTFDSQTWTFARDQVSFNLSGPFALMMCGWFFANVEISKDLFRTMALAAIAPALGVAALAAVSTFSDSDVVFIDSSNLIASGGFGPNQVAGALGFGALLALFIVIDDKSSRTVRALLFGVLTALVMQCALTFSRSGLYMAAGGAAVAAVFAMGDSRLRARFLPMLMAIFVIGNFFVFPYLDAFTDGALNVRFQDTDLTGRDVLIQADIELWKENPVFGVGPGLGRSQRGTFFSADARAGTIAYRKAPTQIAAHTEFSRMLAEHGVFGLGAVLLFIVGAVANVRRAPDARARALVAGLVSWSALFMLSTAMRTVAPSLAFGIGFATWCAQDPNPADAPGRRRRGRGQLRALTAGHPALSDSAPRAATSLK